MEFSKYNIVITDYRKLAFLDENYCGECCIHIHKTFLLHRIHFSIRKPVLLQKGFISKVFVNKLLLITKLSKNFVVDG